MKLYKSLNKFICTLDKNDLQYATERDFIKNLAFSYGMIAFGISTIILDIKPNAVFEVL